MEMACISRLNRGINKTHSGGELMENKFGRVNSIHEGMNDITSSL